MNTRTEEAHLRVAWEKLAQSRQTVVNANEALEDTMRQARANGMTLQAIGNVLGLSRQRVKQLLDKGRDR